MAGYSTTYSGDLTTTIAGKLIDAVKKKIEDRNSSQAEKEVKEIERAAKKPDDPAAVPVKGDLPTVITNMLGITVDSKLMNIESNVNKSLDELTEIKTSHIANIELLVERNDMMASKLDALTEIFSQQLERQKQNLDAQESIAKMRLAAGMEDLSGTRGLAGKKPSKTSAKEKIDNAFGTIGKVLFQRKGGAAAKSLTDKISKAKGFGIRSARILFNKRARSLQNALDYRTSSAFNAMEIQELADNMQVDLKDLPDELKKGGLNAIEDMYKDGLIDEKEYRRLKKTAEGIQGKKIVKAAEGRKIAKKVGKKITSRSGAKILAKGTLGTKLFGKAGKFVPGIGTGIALTEAAFRFGSGDTLGGIMSLGSAIPILGWGFTAADMARDFGFDPLNTKNQYETGTKLTLPGMAALHGTEQLDLMDKESMVPVRQIETIGSDIVSTTMKVAKDAGIERQIYSDIVRLPFSVENIPIQTGIKKTTLTSTPASAPSSQTMGMDVQREIAKAVNAQSDDKGDGGNPVVNFIKNIPGNLRGLVSGIQIPDRFSFTNPLAGPTQIQYHGGQGIDESGEPGVDFSFNDFKNNYAVFDGVVTETGPLYGAAYGNVVVVRSIDPTTGNEFDALYAHFPDGGTKVAEGQEVKAGDLLGAVGYNGKRGPNGEPRMQGNGAGNMSGWHTSLDFFEPNTERGQKTGPYSNASFLVNSLIKMNGFSVKSDEPSGSNEDSEQEGGEGGSGVRTAITALKKDEALSSLTPGTNDYIRPNQSSTVSNTSWDDIDDNTLIYPYRTGVSGDRATIGWGSTFYGDIRKGDQPVSYSDKPITKAQADAILITNIQLMSDEFSRIVPTWKKMNDSQKAAMLVVGYNAPFAYGTYKKYTAAIDRGDMEAAAIESNRGGPSAERLAMEKEMFRDGPLDLSKIEAPKKDSKPFGGLYEEGDDGNFYNIFDGTPLPSNLMSKNIGPTDNGMFQKISNISTEDQTENVIIQPLLLNRDITTVAAGNQQIQSSDSKSTKFDPMAFHMARLSA